MNGTDVMNGVDAAFGALIAHREEIEELDQAIGDGDHIFNLIRGLEAVRTAREFIAPQSLADALKSVARKLLETVGGSSGPLLSTLLMGMAKAVPADPPSSADFARMFAEGVAAMGARGKSGVGEKTMMDVLIPVSLTFTSLTGEGVPMGQILRALEAEAERGMLNTRNMLATKGRASFLGERAVGHIDPGARSCQIVIAALCELARQGTAERSLV